MKINIKVEMDGVGFYKLKFPSGLIIEFQSYGKLLCYDKKQSEKLNYKAIRTEILKDLIVEKFPTLKKEELNLIWTKK